MLLSLSYKCNLQSSQEKTYQQIRHSGTLMLLKRLPSILAFVLCLTIVGLLYLQLAPVYHDYLNPFDVSQRVLSNKQSNLNTVHQANHDIASFELFGSANEPPKNVVVETQNLPKTQLNLTLTGVMVSSDETKAGALIQGPDKQTLNYKINDELPGGATLKQVLNDRVVVDRSGRLENLLFVESRSIGISNIDLTRHESTMYNSPSLNIPNYQTGGMTPPGIPSTNNIPHNQSRTLGIKNRLSKLRKRLLKNRP